MASRIEQLETITKEIKMGHHFFANYDEKSDSINIGTPFMVLTLNKQHLDRDDYLDVVKCSYGRLLEALDYHLLNTPVMGHA